MRKLVINNDTDIEISALRESGIDTLIIEGFDSQLIDIDSLVENKAGELLYYESDDAEPKKYNGYTYLQNATFTKRCNEDLVLVKYYSVVLKNPDIKSALDNVQDSLVKTASDIKDIQEQINPTVDIDKMTLDEYKTYRQEENKKALAEFLSISVVTYNGENYGVMEEDQNEMALQLLSYQTIKSARESELDAIQAKIDAGELVGESNDYATIAEPVLEWHSKKKSCKTFTEQEFLELTYLVKSFVYPYMQKMQKIKEDIFLCETKEAVAAIRIEYA